MWGVDIHKGVINHALKMFEHQPRVHIMQANSKQPNAVAQLGIELGSMDIVSRRASVIAIHVLGSVLSGGALVV